MEEALDYRKGICLKVRAFCDEIVSGKADNKAVSTLKISKDYLDVCRDTSHPSSIKMANRLFEYLMEFLGYYDNIGDAEKLSEIYASMDDKLKNPQLDASKPGLLMPRIIVNVDNALDKIERLTQTHNINFAEERNVTNVQFGMQERNFELSYERDHRVFVSLENVPSQPALVKIDGDDYVIPIDGSHLSGHVVNSTNLDEVSIRFDRLCSQQLKEDKEYYFRYITEVGSKDDISREFEKTYIDVDGQDTYAIDTIVNGRKLTLFTHIFNGKRYMIIEYRKEFNSRAYADFCFSVLVALGMITTKVHLNECWLLAYESEDMSQIEGLYYQSLTDSIQCNYSIFTSNAFPALVNIAQRIDPMNGEHRACDIISNLKLSNGLPWFSCVVFGRLVENMVKYEELRRGIFIILMGSRLHLEMQAAIYCVALEAISNLAKPIIGKKKAVIIGRKKDWKETLRRFKALSEELCKQQVITEGEQKEINKKIESMNKAFNSEKLRALLEYYHYPLRQFDELTLFLRNLLLHGSINFDLIKNRKPEDYLFELSINLHKLCCATALLLSGYNGYIINNRKLYGFANSYKVFIKIGDNVKEDYPMFKEKELSLWSKVSRFFKNLWMSFLS